MTDTHPRPAKTIRIGRQPDNDIALTGNPFGGQIRYSSDRRRVLVLPRSFRY
jgi:hypothetical protein